MESKVFLPITIQLFDVSSLNLFKSSEILQGSLFSFPITLFLEIAQINLMAIKLKSGQIYLDGLHNLRFQNLHK